MSAYTAGPTGSGDTSLSIDKVKKRKPKLRVRQKVIMAELSPPVVPSVRGQRNIVTPRMARRGGK